MEESALLDLTWFSFEWDQKCIMWSWSVDQQKYNKHAVILLELVALFKMILEAKL